MSRFQRAVDRIAAGVATTSILAQLVMGTPARAAESIESAPTSPTPVEQIMKGGLRSFRQALTISGFRLDAPSVVGNGPGIYQQAGGDVSDLDNDGRLDVVTANVLQGQDRVFWMGEAGDLSQTEHPSDDPNYSVAAGKLLGDSNTDIVSARGDVGGNVVIIPGTGSGFGAPQQVNVGTPTSNTLAVDVGDFNNDSKDDFAVTVADVGSAGVRVMRNDVGGFVEGPLLAVPPRPQCVVVANLDQDNDLDLVVATKGAALNGTDPGMLSVFLMNPDGSAHTTIPLNPGNGTVGVAARDIDLDGNIDLVAVNFGSNNAVVYRNTGNAIDRFAAAATLTLPGSPTGVAIVDTGDGKMSLAISQEAGSQTQGIALFPGTSTLGNISFDQRVDIATTSGTMRGVIAYPCEDWDKIVAIEDNKTAIIDPAKLGNISDMSSPLPSGTARGIGVADLNNDGRLDQVVLVSSPTQSVAVTRMGQPNGSLGPKFEFSISGTRSDMKLADVDGDNVPDLTVVGNTTTIYRGNGDGTFNSTAFADVAGSGGIRVEVADFDGNGKKDIAALSSSGQQVRVSLQSEGGTFPPATPYTTVSSPTDFSYGDVTGDGIGDFVAPNSSGLMKVFQGAANGTFSTLPNVSVPSGVSAVRIADFDGNASKDVVVGTSTGVGSVQTMISAGGGAFSAPVSSPTGGPVTTNGMVAADLDFDGKADIAVTNVTRNVFSVHINNGDGTLQPARQYGTQAIAPQDMVVDAASLPSIYVMNRDSQSVTRADNLTPGGTTDVAPVAGPDANHRLEMSPPYPNPVNGVSIISFALADAARVDLNVYDVRGALVRKLIPLQELPAGSHTFRWDLRDEAGANVSTGVYFIRGHADGDVVSRKLMVLK